MSSKFQFRNTWYNLAPEWLTTGNAEKYMYTLQYCSDVLMEKMNQAMRFRMPGQGDVSQLPYLANDRQLIQGPSESVASFVARLQSSIQDWKKAGSKPGIMQQIQAYLSNLQPGVSATLPLMTIVGGCYNTVTTWDTLYQGSAIGAQPTKTTVTPSNFNWDGKSQPWRAWLILYMSQVATGLSGSNPAAASVSNGSLLGQNVNGVWVPGTSGTPVNSPFITYTGLSGLSSSNLGQWLTISGTSHAANNGTWPIVAIVSSTSCTVANPAGATAPAGGTWSIGSYPFIAPGPPWGTSGYTFGQGQTETPPLDTGSNVGGVWQPGAVSGGQPTISWGLSCSANTIATIRSLLQRWKSNGTYYPDIIVCFDGNTGGLAGDAYSPASSPGSGNPDGTFGSRGKLVSGNWVPARLINSTFDAYCQGTGTHVNCTVENVT